MIRQFCIFLCLCAVSSTAHSADSVRVKGADEWRVQAAKVRFALRELLTREGTELIVSDRFETKPSPLDLAGRKAVGEASKAIDTLMLDEAAQVLEGVLSEVSARPAELRDPNWYAEAYQTLGIIYGLRGERDRARSVWSTSKRLAPDLQPNPALFNPDMRSLYDAIEVGTQFGALRVTSTPAGLDVYVDGFPRGVTPFRAERVPVGEVTLRVQGQGGAASGQRILVLPGRESAVDFPNAPEPINVASASSDDACDTGINNQWIAEVSVVADRMEVTTRFEPCNDERDDFSFRVVTSLDVDEESLVRELALELRANTLSDDDSLNFNATGIGACGGISCARFKNVVVWSTLGTSLAIGAGGGVLWWLAGQDEKVFRDQSYPRNLEESLAISDRGKLRALIGDIMVATAGAGIVSAASLWLFWDPGTELDTGTQLSVVPFRDGLMVGLIGEF